MTAGTHVATGVRLAGTELSREIRARVSVSAAALTAAGRPPRLTVVVATTDESTAWYVVRGVRPHVDRSSTPSVRRRKETVCNDALRLRLLRG